MGRPPLSEEEKARREAEKGEKRPVGRPRLTAEQLAERDAQKEQLAIQNEMEQNAYIIQHSLAGLSAAPVNLLDAEEVVRCKDCKFWKPQGWKSGWCEQFNGAVTSDNGYCYRAQRSDEVEP